MDNYTSIRIRRDIAEKLRIIKKENNCKSNNELLEQLIPNVVTEEYIFTTEKPVFTIGDTKISWSLLKECHQGTEWICENDRCTVIFKDDYGAFIRFIINEEVFLEYFHFL